jgi:hypothetical protein
MWQHKFSNADIYAPFDISYYLLLVHIFLLTYICVKNRRYYQKKNERLHVWCVVKIALFWYKC